MKASGWLIILVAICLIAAIANVAERLNIESKKSWITVKPKPKTAKEIAEKVCCKIIKDSGTVSDLEEKLTETYSFFRDQWLIAQIKTETEEDRQELVWLTEVARNLNYIRWKVAIIANNMSKDTKAWKGIIEEIEKEKLRSG